MAGTSLGASAPSLFFVPRPRRAISMVTLARRQHNGRNLAITRRHVNGDPQRDPGGGAQRDFFGERKSVEKHHQHGDGRHGQPAAYSHPLPARGR